MLFAVAMAGGAQARSDRAAAGPAAGKIAYLRQSLATATIVPVKAVSRATPATLRHHWIATQATITAADVRDRFDVRALRLEPPRGTDAGPFTTGLRLNLTGDMNASVAITGPLRAVMRSTIIE